MVHRHPRDGNGNGNDYDGTTMAPSSAACRPPSGRTYLTIGQDLFSIQDYVTEAYNYSLHQYMDHHQQQNNSNSKHSQSITKESESVPSRSSVWPAAYMAYTDLEKLQGLDEPVDYGSGIEYANGLSSSLSNDRGGLQLGLWLGGSTGCRAVVSGQWNAQLQSLVDYIISCPFSVVWIRVGYEFDNPGFGYTTTDDGQNNHNPNHDENETPAALFRNAFSKIVQTCRKQPQCRSKALFVWHSWAAGGLPENQTIHDYYPGSHVVDWIGISVFQQFYPNQPNTMEDLIRFAKQQQKPVMIAESTPFGGWHVLTDPWNQWFQPILNLIQQHDLSMWSYINCDWESQPMWHTIGFGDTRLAQNHTLQQLWHRHVLKNPRFWQNQNGPLCQQRNDYNKNYQYDYDYSYSGKDRGDNYRYNYDYKYHDDNDDDNYSYKNQKSSWFSWSSFSRPKYLIPSTLVESPVQATQTHQQQLQPATPLGHPEHYLHGQHDIRTMNRNIHNMADGNHMVKRNTSFDGGSGSHFYALSYYYWYAALLLVTVFWFVRFWLQQSLAQHTGNGDTIYNRRRRGGEAQSIWQLDHSPLFVRKLLSRIPEVSERDEESTLAEDIDRATHEKEYGTLLMMEGKDKQ